MDVPAGRVRLLDVNVLLALVWDHHVHHRRARLRFAELGAFATTPITESGLMRLLLTPAVVGRAVAPSEVLATLTAVRALPSWRWVPDSTSLVDGLVDVRVLAGSRQVTDLHLVEIAARSSCVLATFDAALPTWLAPDDRRHVEVWRP